MSRASLLPAGTTLVGEIRGRGDLIVAGSVEGPIDIEGELTIEADARVIGDVQATRISIRGVLEGDAVAVETIRIEPSAHVVGLARAGRVNIIEGARFRGRVEMNEQDAAAAAPRRRRKRGRSELDAPGRRHEDRPADTRPAEPVTLGEVTVDDAVEREPIRRRARTDRSSVAPLEEASRTAEEAPSRPPARNQERSAPVDREEPAAEVAPDERIAAEAPEERSTPEADEGRRRGRRRSRRGRGGRGRGRDSNDARAEDAVEERGSAAGEARSRGDTSDAVPDAAADGPRRRTRTPRSEEAPEPRPEAAPEPRASEPRASEPRASEPRASEPRASEPRAPRRPPSPTIPAVHRGRARRKDRPESST